MKKKRSFIMGCLLLVAMLPYTFFASAQTKVTVKVEDNSYRVIRGKVTDAEGHSLPGVNVRVKGVQGGTVGDIDGNFMLSAPREDVVLIVSYIGMVTQEVTVKVSDETPYPVSEFGDYRISHDTMTLEAVFYPPFKGAVELTYEEIQKDLKNIGVISGISEEAIRLFLLEKRYFETYVLAKGTKAREGSDGYIEYTFNTSLKPTPKMNEDGTVDFHTLENVNHIKSGDVVAILHPEDRGDNGTDILGRPVYPRKVKRAVFRYGKNMEVSEDKLKLISKVDGHVTLENDKVFVSNVLELVDVDASTGDINYSGSVMIKGNVLAGFSVKAAGDISVSGIVEGATIIADGDITFNRGVQGMNKAVIKAGGNIVSKFIESASSVEAGGNIESDSILHSKVRAKGTIKASGRNGLIVGGEVRSICLVEAKNIGNEMGTATVVGVGVDPAAKKRVDELKTSLQKLGDSKIQLNQIMTALRKKQEIEGKLAPDKVELQQKTMRNLVMIEKDLTEQKNELEQLRQQLGEDVNARVRVSGNIYVGVKLIFGEQNYFIKEKRTFCQFVKDKADIKWQSL